MIRQTLAFLFLSLFLINCAAQAPEITLADESLLKSLRDYSELDAKSRVKLNSKEDVGKTLLILGILRSKETKEPITNHKFRLYQAGVDGNYNEKVKGDEKTARISGDVTTDSKGRFFVETILPGDYGTAAGNRHIHMFIPNSQPRAYDFYFGDFVSSSLRSWAEASDQAEILKLSKDNHDNYVARGELFVRGFAMNKQDKE